MKRKIDYLGELFAFFLERIHRTDEKSMEAKNVTLQTIRIIEKENSIASFQPYLEQNGFTMENYIKFLYTHRKHLNDEDYDEFERTYKNEK